jgi:hypothetical protein
MLTTQQKGAHSDRHAGEPVLVDRAEAREILNVTDATFARLCREGRFENMVCEGSRAGSHELYRSAALRAYRAQDKRLGGSLGSITNAAGEPSRSAPLRVTSGTEIGAGAGERPGTTNDTWPRCEGCHKPFRPHRAGMRVCSAACRKRRSRRIGRAAACAA